MPMQYLDNLERSRLVRANTVSLTVERLMDLGRQLVDLEEDLLSHRETFHSRQNTFRVTEWLEIDLRLPQKNQSSMAFEGPYLSECQRAEGRVRKKRVPISEVAQIVGKGFMDTQSAYIRLGTRLTEIAKRLDSRLSPRIPDLPKGQRRDAFVLDRQKRIKAMVTTVGELHTALNGLDEQADERIFDFNEIEGKKKRYGSLVCRWDIPSRLPVESVAVPAGPEVFYIAYDRTYRMTKPIAQLYEKVHGRPPGNSIPLTKPMIQRSRLGKYFRRYREAYGKIAEIREARLSIVDDLETIHRMTRGTHV